MNKNMKMLDYVSVSASEGVSALGLQRDLESVNSVLSTSLDTEEPVIIQHITPPADLML